MSKTKLRYCEICGVIYRPTNPKTRRMVCDDCTILDAKYCKWCGKVITVKGRSSYCSNECRMLADADKRKNNSKKVKARLEEEKEKNSLEAIVKKATECGLTYGQYVAKLEAKKRRL